VPYDLQFYPRDPETRYAKDTQPNSGKGLSAVHPLGRSPVLEVDGVVVAEAGAVLTLLLQHFPKQGAAGDGADDPRPMDLTSQGQELNFWVQFGESSLFLHAIPFMYGFKGGVIDASSDGSSVYEKTCARGLKADLDYLESALGKKGGSLTEGGRVGPADVSTFEGGRPGALPSLQPLFVRPDSLTLSPCPVDLHRNLRRVHQDNRAPPAARLLLVQSRHRRSARSKHTSLDAEVSRVAELQACYGD
jgi:glutathione S-transferase